MNITECFPMRKRRSIDKTPGRSHDARVFSPPVSRLRCTPRRLAGSSCNNSFLDQSLEIVWDNNSPSPTRTLSLGKRKKHHGSDSSSSGGEISDLVQKLADKSGNTPEANPPLLAFWMSRENTTVQANNDNIAAKGNNPSKQKSKEFQTPSRRPRRVLRKCNKSKMKLLKQDIELLAHPMEKTDEEPVIKETLPKSSEQQQESNTNAITTCTSVKLKGTELKGTDSSDFFDGWDTDEDDLILSQVHIPAFKNNVQETQVMTNTQFLGSGEDTHQNNVTQQPSLTKDHGAVDVDTNDNIVTESWDFVDEFGDSDDENILQNALEDFEKSQQVSIPTVRRVSHPDMSHVTGVQKKELCDSSCKVNPLGQSSYVATRSNDHCSAQQREHIAAEVKSSRKSNFSFIPRSTLQSSASVRSDNLTAQQVKQHNIKNTNSLVLPQTGIQRMEKEQTNFQNISERKSVEINATRQHNSTEQRMVQRESKAVKYSKEDIERKKLDAQNRRRQKMTQSQHKHHS